MLADCDAMDGHPEAIVDLDVIRSNVAELVRYVGGAQVMAVVKSDGYGHGMVPTAVAALAAGATWLGVGHVSEAVELRKAGLRVPVLCLLASPDAPHREAIGLGIDLSAGSASLVRQIAAAAELAGRPARLHLKADTGMGRGGAPLADWPALVAAALDEQAAGRCEIVGLWSHLACADLPGHPSVDAQLDAFRAAIDRAERAGARPQVRHLANTPAVITRPDSWFDLVRPGGGVTGLATLPGGPPGWLRPAMTVRTRLVQVKQVPGDTPVSYGHRYRTRAQTTLGLIPLGYHEGIPRSATNTAQVMVRGSRWTIAGTVCMNQCVIDVGDARISPGDEVVLFGPGDRGEPTAQEWADAIGTISYDVVTRFTAKIPRSYRGVTEAGCSGAEAAGAGRRDGRDLADAPSPGRREV
ncbi:MAG TPA: alanine racemase [Streptosporangiaceae bacterium]|nr:alanine racemase [Streptosporangiaceae bacterium]